jgi:serine/threonine protein kinase
MNQIPERYRIESSLGSGAYAGVHKGTDKMLKRTVALKVLKPALFQPHISRMLEMGEADRCYFIAMCLYGLPLIKNLSKQRCQYQLMS